MTTLYRIVLICCVRSSTLNSFLVIVCSCSIKSLNLLLLYSTVSHFLLVHVHVGVCVPVLVLVQSVSAVLHSRLQSQSVWDLLLASWILLSLQRTTNAQGQAEC